MIETTAEPVDFTAEASKMAASSKESYIDDIPFEETSGTDENAQDWNKYAQENLENAKPQRKYYRTAQSIIAIHDMAVPLVLALIMKAEYSYFKFDPDPDDKEEFTEALAAVCEYEDMTVTGPYPRLIVAWTIGYGWPIYEKWKALKDDPQRRPFSNYKETEKKPSNDDAETVEQEDVPSEPEPHPMAHGSGAAVQPTIIVTSSTVQTPMDNIRPCEICGKALKQKQKKYCSNKCRGIAMSRRAA